ncbi:MAG: flagellar hook-associated protein FlgK [Rhodocyclaceae bacterium]
MASLLSIGLTGLNAAQAQLTTTSHNITNANVTGYSREQVIQGTQQPLYTGAGFFGQGTQVQTVKRIYSQFLENQTMAADAAHSKSETYYNEIAQIDNLLGDETVGLSSALTSYFNSVQSVAANPSDVSARQSMLSFAEALAGRFSSLNQRMDEIRSGVESQISTTVDSINTLAKQLADLNHQIVVAQASGPGVPANDLLDTRNALIQELNRNVQVTTTTESDGSVSVFIGTGQPLVVGNSTYTLTATPSDSDPKKLQLGIQLLGGNSAKLSDSMITGGSLAGLLAFRSDALDAAQNALGRVAVGVTETFNAQHQLGIDLNGAMGGDFFTPIKGAVQNLPAFVTGTISSAQLDVSYSNVGNLTTDDYVLSFDGTNYNLQRSSDGKSVYSGATLPTDVNGISISLTSGSIAAGDRFLIQPTRYAASSVNVAITDTRLIAAGAPITTSAASSNSGTASISQGSVVSGTGISATSPHIGDITVTFDSATNTFVLGGAASGTLAYNPVADASGKSFTLASPNISFSISGAPKNGDTFTITSNDGGVSDGRNAVALGNLQTTKNMLGGSATYATAYSQIVSKIGTQTHAAEINTSTQQTLLEQAQAAQQSVSGVNLDEEAANLLRYQQAYQAAARVMSTAQTLFEAVLNIAR